MTGNAAPDTGADEVVVLTSDLIRIDTTNSGDDRGPGERAAAEHVATLLADAGLAPVILESRPGRASVITRVAGVDQSRPALLIHGHLDVVPADPADWRVHPLSGEVSGGCVWGRGAVDMKNMNAMVVTAIRQQLRERRRPARDVVLAFVADEEAGSDLGARWLVDEHPELFEGVSEAIGEVGGFSTTVAGQRLYLVQTAEKGLAWLRLTARGTAGHGSMVHQENAVTALADTVARIGRHKWRPILTPTVSAFLAQVCQLLGIDAVPENWDEVMHHLGPIAAMTAATLTSTANPTMFTAGYKVNVVPQTATAHVDGRFVPGHEEEFFAEFDKLLDPAVTREIAHYEPAVQTTFDGDLCAAMSAALLAHDPGARIAPYCISGATDAKSFSRLGIRCFGFAPLRLPADLNFASMFHGVDERVPVESLRFGVSVLDQFLTCC